MQKTALLYVAQIKKHFFLTDPLSEIQLVCDGRTDRPMDGRVDISSYRDARTHLKTSAGTCTSTSTRENASLVRTPFESILSKTIPKICETTESFLHFLNFYISFKTRKCLFQISRFCRCSNGTVPCTIVTVMFPHGKLT